MFLHRTSTESRNLASTDVCLSRAFALAQCHKSLRELHDPSHPFLFSNKRTRFLKNCGKCTYSSFVIAFPVPSVRTDLPPSSKTSSHGEANCLITCGGTTLHARFTWLVSPIETSAPSTGTKYRPCLHQRGFMFPWPKVRCHETGFWVLLSNLTCGGTCARLTTESPSCVLFPCCSVNQYDTSLDDNHILHKCKSSLVPSISKTQHFTCLVKEQECPNKRQVFRPQPIL